jgi:hypothetical protein
MCNIRPVFTLNMDLSNHMRNKRILGKSILIIMLVALITKLQFIRTSLNDLIENLSYQATIVRPNEFVETYSQNLNYEQIIKSTVKKIMTRPIQYKYYSNKNLTFGFDYPSQWKIEETYMTLDNYKEATIDLVSLNDDCSITIHSQMWDPKIFSEEYCTEDTPCEGDGEKYPVKYEHNKFEKIATLDNQDIVISKTGGYSDNGDKGILSEELQPNQSYFVFIIIDNEIAAYMSILDHGTVGDFLNSSKLSISYEFKNKDAVLQWPEYKPILKDIVRSMKRQ